MAWGRVDADIRLRRPRWHERLFLIPASPLLPPLVFSRILRDRMRARQSMGPFFDDCDEVPCRGNKARATPIEQLVLPRSTPCTR